VGEAHYDNKMEFDRENREIQESNGPRTTPTKVEPEWALEQATWSPIWAIWPTLVLPRLALHPWSGLRPICSIFTCYTFCFELN
jgi:hypothetical protein